MASDFNKPVVGDAYAALLPAITATFQDLAASSNLTTLCKTTYSATSL
jgi:hypothetical protein